MRTLVEIIEDCKLNKEPSIDELRYAVIALTSIINMTTSTLMELYKKDMNVLEKKRLENTYNAYSTVLNKSPKEWLGWNNDPENPAYQKLYSIGSKLLDKALKGELPNQKYK